MTKQKLKMQKAPKAYKISPEKLSELPQRVFALVMCDTMYFCEDYKYFDVIKPYLDIPPEPKSLEELQQELDEKFEELLVKTKRRFAVSKESAEYHYNRKFDNIIDNFEEAKKWGRFPGPIKLVMGTGSDFITTNSSFVISNSNKVGYYELVDGVRMESAVKPNPVVRFMTKWLLGWKWKDV